MSILQQFKDRYEATQEEEHSLEEYLAICKEDPAAYATAAERMLIAIGEPELVDTSLDPRLSRIFSNKVIKRYPEFSEFYGMEDAVENIVSFFRHAAQGLVNDGFMLEFLQSHSAVIYQPPFDSPYYSGINPYTLGFSIFTDLRRICENPTDEDREWFPDIAGSDWLETLHFAMHNFKDESFIQQFLSPKVMRDLKLFAIENDELEDHYTITAIHDDPGYRPLREKLARQYNLSYREPNIQVWNVDVRGDRSLTLRHIPVDRVPLGEDTEEVVRHVHRLWGFDVHLESVDEGKVVEEFHCPTP